MTEGVSIFTPSSSPPSNPSPAVPVERSTPRVASHTSVADVRSNPTEAPWQARWDADQRALDRENPWRDPRVAITKSPDGSLQVRQRGDARPNGAPNAGEQQPGQPQAPLGPASVADGKLRVGGLELGEEEIRGLLQRKGAEDSRRAQMPASADLYELSMPSDFTPPAGTGEWKFDTENAVTGSTLGMVMEWAFANGLDQSQFSRLLSFYAGHQLHEQRQFNEARAAEIAKLGATGASRIDAVNTWLEAMCGSQLAGAVRRTLFTSDQVRAMEALISKFTSQGVSGSPGAHRDGGHRENRLSEADYQKLSFHEKTEYAKRFDQSQFNGG